MKCPYCMEPSPDNARSCQRCGRVLDPTIIARSDSSAPGSRAPTVVEPQAGRTEPVFSGVRPSPPPPLPSSAPVAPGGARRGNTVYMPPPATGAATGEAPAPRLAQRRIVGILVTYSWKPDGQVFPVREGRNLIGRGEECDIRIADDPMLSQVNSHITFRRNFVVGDMVSMGGTDLDGQAVEEQFRALGNYARIRTGSTHWTFVMLEPDAVQGRE